ncbi:hypothetical protein INR49_007641 [Caranx melampygus]|nr:hypothetical protein INR49_007641 [Caranx melampygus]
MEKEEERRREGDDERPDGGIDMQRRPQPSSLGERGVYFLKRDMKGSLEVAVGGRGGDGCGFQGQCLHSAKHNFEGNLVEAVGRGGRWLAG